VGRGHHIEQQTRANGADCVSLRASSARPTHRAATMQPARSHRPGRPPASRRRSLLALRLVGTLSGGRQLPPGAARRAAVPSRHKPNQSPGAPGEVIYKDAQTRRRGTRPPRRRRRECHVTRGPACLPRTLLAAMQRCTLSFVVAIATNLPRTREKKEQGANSLSEIFPWATGTMRGRVVRKPGGKIPPNPGGFGGQVRSVTGVACCRA